MLNVVIYGEGVSRWILQKTYFTSNLEKTNAAEFLGDLIQCRGFVVFLMMPLFQSQGSKKIQRVTSGLWGYVREDTHSIGSVTGAITCRSTISCMIFSVCSWYSFGTYLYACWTGSIDGSK